LSISFLEEVKRLKQFAYYILGRYSDTRSKRCSKDFQVVVEATTNSGLKGMDYQNLHPWNVTAREAITIQADLRKRIELKDSFNQIRVVAGADVSFDKSKKEGYGGVIAYSFPELEEIERRGVRKEVTFPYVPGLLAFREAPVLLDAFASLKVDPDVILFDGQGLAHFRRMGIATHMGILLNKPAIGCAKSRLIGSFEEPEDDVGSYSPLVDRGETVGVVLRTRKRVRPIFVSPGHKISLKTCVDIVLKCVDDYRIPKPTREADRYVALIKKEPEVIKSNE
jgi:deoxyribonuclease V